MDISTLENIFYQILKENSNLLAIDLDNELNLYKNEDSDEFADNLIRTIKRYEELLVQQQENGVDTSATVNLISVLNRELEEYIGKKTLKHKVKKLTKEEISRNTLKRIFEFYNRKKAIASKTKSFDKTNDEVGQMFLSNYMKLLKDFEINIPIQTQKEFFVKIASYGKFLTFDQFTLIMGKVAEAWNLQKVKELEWKKTLIVFKLNRNKKKIEVNPNLESIKTKIEKLTKEIEELNFQIIPIKNRTLEESTQLLYNYMGIFSSDGSVTFYLICSIA